MLRRIIAGEKEKDRIKSAIAFAEMQKVGKADLNDEKIGRKVGWVLQYSNKPNRPHPSPQISNRPPRAHSRSRPTVKTYNEKRTRGKKLEQRYQTYKSLILARVIHRRWRKKGGRSERMEVGKKRGV